MLGISWSEIFLICAVALIVIGPKDIPKVMFQIGRVVRRLQYVKFAFSQQFEDFLKEHDLDDLRHGVNFEAKIHHEDSWLAATAREESDADEEFIKEAGKGSGLNTEHTEHTEEGEKK